MKRRTKRIKSEPVISLINIVFLILIFFMVAGTLAQPPKDLQFVRTQGLACCSDPDALAINREGELRYKGKALSDIETFLTMRGEAGGAVKLLPDAQLPAAQLLRIAAQVKRSGSDNIVILTQTQPR